MPYNNKGKPPDSFFESGAVVLYPLLLNMAGVGWRLWGVYVVQYFLLFVYLLRRQGGGVHHNSQISFHKFKIFYQVYCRDTSSTLIPY